MKTETKIIWFKINIVFWVIFSLISLAFLTVPVRNYLLAVMGLGAISIVYLALKIRNQIECFSIFDNLMLSITFLPLVSILYLFAIVLMAVAGFLPIS